MYIDKGIKLMNYKKVGQGFPITRFLDDTQTHYIMVGHLWKSDQSDAETSTRQHTTIATDKQPCPR
jgi:hypothetical protein